MTQVAPISEIRNNLRNLVDDLYAENGAVIIQRNGKPMAAMISYDDFLAVERILLERHTQQPAHSR